MQHRIRLPKAANELSEELKQTALQYSDVEEKQKIYRRLGLKYCIRDSENRKKELMDRMNQLRTKLISMHTRMN